MTIAGAPVSVRQATLLVAVGPLPDWCFPKSYTADVLDQVTAIQRLLNTTPRTREECVAPLLRTRELVKKAPGNPGFMYLHGIALGWAGELPEAEAAFLRSNELTHTFPGAQDACKWGYPEANYALAIFAALDKDAAQFAARLSAFLPTVVGNERGGRSEELLRRVMNHPVAKALADAPEVKDLVRRAKENPLSTAEPVAGYQDSPMRWVPVREPEENTWETEFRKHHNLIAAGAEAAGIPFAKVSLHPIDLVYSRPGLDIVSDSVETVGVQLLLAAADSQVDVRHWLGDAAADFAAFQDEAILEAAALLYFAAIDRMRHREDFEAAWNAQETDIRPRLNGRYEEYDRARGRMRYLRSLGSTPR
ncbi:MAG: hypothetical protein ACKVPX_04635 [Myxococcaceae bacterium]